MKIKELKRWTWHQALRPIGHNYNTIGEDSNQSNSVWVLQETPPPEVYTWQHKDIETPNEGQKSETANIHNLLGKKNNKSLELTEENIKKHNKQFQGRDWSDDEIDFD